MENIIKKAKELEYKFKWFCDLSCHGENSNCKYLKYLEPDCVFMWMAEETLKTVNKN